MLLYLAAYYTARHWPQRREQSVKYGAHSTSPKKWTLRLQQRDVDHRRTSEATNLDRFNDSRKPGERTETGQDQQCI